MPKDRDSWMLVHQTFCKLLERRNIDYCIIPSDMASVTDRVDVVVRANVKKVEHAT